jgi:hypothetical protein
MMRKGNVSGPRLTVLSATERLHGERASDLRT